MCKCLNYQSTYAASRLHILRGGMCQLDLLPAEANRFCPTIRKIDNFCRYMSGQAEQVCSICTTWLQSRGKSPRNSASNSVWVRSQDPEFRMPAWIVVKTSGEAMQGPLGGQT